MSLFELPYWQAFINETADDLSRWMSDPAAQLTKHGVELHSRASRIEANEFATFEQNRLLLIWAFSIRRLCEEAETLLNNDLNTTYTPYKPNMSGVAEFAKRPINLNQCISFDPTNGMKLGLTISTSATALTNAILHHTALRYQKIDGEDGILFNSDKMGRKRQKDGSPDPEAKIFRWFVTFSQMREISRAFGSIPPAERGGDQV